MRILLPLLLALAIPAMVSSPATTDAEATAAATDDPEPQTTVTIVVTATKLRSDDGYARFALFDGPKGFPGRNRSAVGAKQVRIKNGRATVKFKGLPAGTYAVALHHDENGNGKMDSRAMGIPTEGYGVSRNPKYGWGPPKWNDAKFEVPAGAEVGLTIKTFYPRWSGS